MQTRDSRTEPGDEGSGTFTKQLLVEISHAMERFALAGPDEPRLVIAMFQRLAYFRREAEMYRRIAERGATVLVGLVEQFPPDLPPGVRHLLLGDGDELAREWSVTVLGPHGGATLVAEDEERVTPGARTLEAGRRFHGRWSFRRRDAYAEVLRLRAAASSRLPVDTLRAIDDVLSAVVTVPEPPGQEWLDAPLRFLVDRMDLARRGGDSLRGRLDEIADPAGERDPRTGLLTERFLRRWTAGLGPGTLPLGLVLLRVDGAAELRHRYGLRAELAAMQGVAQCFARQLSDVDRVVRMGHEDFLAVLPARRPDEVLRFSEEVTRQISTLEQQYPFVPLAGAAAATVTRQRPLPLPALADQVARVSAARAGVSLLVG